MILRRAAPILALCAVATALTVAQQEQPRAPLGPWLRSRLGMSVEQVAAVRLGRPVAVALATPVDREIQVGGAVHVRAAAKRVADAPQGGERLGTGGG